MSLHRRYFLVCARVLRATALGALTLLAAAARAEDLVQVYDLARAHDAALQAAQAQSRATLPRALQARAALRPNLTATGSSTWSRYEPSASEADPSGTRVDSRVASLALNLRQPVYSRAANIDVAIADLAQESARADLEITQQDFILRVAQAYFDVLSAQDLLVTKRQSKSSFGEQLEWARRRFQAGLGIITDQHDAQARYDLAESEQVAAENDLRARRLALDRLTGRQGIEPKVLAMQPSEPPIPPGELDSWQRDAAQHPAVRRAQLALDRARLDTGRARAGHMPTVDVVGSMSKNRVGGGSSPVSTSLPGRNVTSSLGVEINIPLFSGYSTQNRIAETLILEEQATQNLQAVIQSTTETTERAYFDFRSTMAQVKALEAAEGSSRISLEGTQLGYRAGVRTNLDVLNAQTLLFQTRSDLARARYDVLIRGLRLTASAGTLQPDRLLAINRLLVP